MNRMLLPIATLALIFITELSVSASAKESAAANPPVVKGYELNDRRYLTVEGARASVGGGELTVASGGLKAAATPDAPYELSFEARMPQPSPSLPDLGIGQVWFSIDYANETDRLAFAVRGGRLQDIIGLDFAQPRPPIEDKKMPPRTGGAAFRRAYWPLPANIEAGQWFRVCVRVLPGEVSVFINDEPALYHKRTMTPGRPFCLGGSWQTNSFRAIQVGPTGQGAIKPAAPDREGEPRDPAELASRRAQERESYQATTLAPLGDRHTASILLDGQWLFKPTLEAPADAIEPNAADDDWHVVDVPSFWRPIGCWIYTSRQVMQSFLHEEWRRCNRQTFDWRQTKSAYYRKWLEVPEDWAGHRVRVDFNAVASVCVVYCNGIEVGRNTGMFRPFSVDLTRALKPGRGNLLALFVHSGEPDQTVADARQTQAVAVTMPITREMLTGIPRGMYWIRPSVHGAMTTDTLAGIWQSVTLSVSRELRIDDVWPRGGLDRLDLQVTADGAEPAFADAALRVRVGDHQGHLLIDEARPWRSESATSETVGASHAPRVMNLGFGGLSPRHWSPDAPELYDLTVEIVRGESVLDSYHGKIGFRTFETKGNKFYLNGRPYRWLGANMPPASLKPNDRELARAFFAMMKAGNQNATRSHAAPFSEVWLDEADRQGIMVSIEGTWPWLMITDSEIPERESLDVWKSEWLDLMKRLRRHPSIVMWTINNEPYFVDDPDVARRRQKSDINQDVLAGMRAIDSTRPVCYFSGYTRALTHDLLKAADADWDAKDDGDVDDGHTYFGTYSPSMIGHRADVEKFLHSLIRPDRPFISQEAATAYPNTDTGHQEPQIYVSAWHGQAWLGNDAYEFRDPRPFLDRHARLTAEQAEAVRRLPVAGWLLFSNSCWYGNALDADGMIPYPVHESVRRALAPVLVAMDMPVRQFFVGERIEPKVFVVNDDLKGRALSGLELTARVENAAGEALTGATADFPDVPHFESRELDLALTLPALSGAERSSLTLVLELRGRAGAAEGPTETLLGTNQYALTVCSREYVQSGRAIEIYSAATLDEPVAAALGKSGIVIKPGLPERDGGLAVFTNTGEEDWPEVARYVESGGRALVLNPRSLPDAWGLENAETTTTQCGECAQVPDDRTSPLLEKMDLTDLAWWARPGGEPGVCGQALVFHKDIAETIDLKVSTLPPHGYAPDSWRMEYALIGVHAGKGRVDLCTLDFSGAATDPLAARFLSNLVASLEAEGTQ